tara:strand:- start:292 stop:543 length:252 start_codon:yes stop_codon:yes gene_type:complete
LPIHPFTPDDPVIGRGPDQRHRAHDHYQQYQRIPVSFDPAFQAFQSLFNSHDSLLMVADSKKTPLSPPTIFTEGQHGKEKAPG